MCIKITMKCILNVCALLCLTVCGGLDPRAELGYPRGLYSVCPGMMKAASIPRSQLKHLHFLVQGKGRTRRKYNYWTASHIAHDPRIHFDRKTIVICLGYLDHPAFIIGSLLADAYEDNDYNVLIIDYNRFATVHYYLASRLMRPVGFHVAEVLIQLTHSGLQPSKLELVGFSLGGHTISYIASNYQRLSGKNISRITSLEPSGPCFRSLKPEDRLNPSNADFVEVVHTNIDGFGMAQRMGHVDFYVNGGEYQPSELALYPCASTCSHFRVIPLWLSAMRYSGKFLSLKCDSIQQARDANCYSNPSNHTIVLGLYVDRSKHGIYYLSTRKAYPYYLGDKGLRAEYAAWRTVTDVNGGNETEIFT